MFSVVIFLSAFLLFIAQPLLGKTLLPWFGGSSAVWLSVVVFFQSCLLVGYFYAYLLSKLRSFVHQMSLHTIFLCASLLFLPLAPSFSGQGEITWVPLFVFKVLTGASFLPIMLIATTSPLFQYWYAKAYQVDFPYRYYALSNLGSLLGLLCFPFLIEPYYGLALQRHAWSVLYGVYFASTLISLVLLHRRTKKLMLTPSVEISSPSYLKALSWVAFSALGCMLLLTSTQWMLQNVVGFPLFWIIPLSLYLVSFIITFSDQRRYRKKLWLTLYAITSIVILFITTHHQLLLHLQLVLYSTLVLTGCMICHGELFQRKPEKQHLTFYYLMIALGGVLGGVSINLISPLIFNEWWDFYITLIAIPFSLSLSQITEKRKPYVTSGLCVLFLVLIIHQLKGTHEGTLLVHRNFYGKSEIAQDYRGNTPYLRQLLNGSIIHGNQFLDPGKRHIATTYFATSSGVGLAIDFQQRRKGPIKIGVIGLGAGTIAALCKPGDTLHFYEIDPDMVSFAYHYFSYLKDTPAQVDIILGDARLSLEEARLKNDLGHYDVLAIDAFNGDAIPVHLVTKEAIELYLSHLAPNGILAFHISSRYLSLYPPLQALALDAGIPAYLTLNSPEYEKGIFSATWVLMSFEPMLGLSLFQRHALLFNEKRTNEIWTDDKNSLLHAINW